MVVVSNNGEVSELAMAFALVYIVFAGLFCVSILWLVAVGWWRTWRNRVRRGGTWWWRHDPRRRAHPCDDIACSGWCGWKDSNP